MRVLFTAAALVTAGAAVPALQYTAPPPGHTGGFGEPTCVSCHMGDEVNAYGGSVSIVGLPDRWEAGARYPITVVLQAEETSVAGFQLAARWATGEDAGTPAGTLGAMGEDVAVTPGETGQPYAHHTAAGTRTADPDGAEWAVRWTAPEGGNGPVVFHVAANSGNGDDSPLLDLVYVAEVEVEAAGSTR